MVTPIHRSLLSLWVLAATPLLALLAMGCGGELRTGESDGNVGWADTAPNRPDIPVPRFDPIEDEDDLGIHDDDDQGMDADSDTSADSGAHRDGPVGSDTTSINDTGLDPAPDSTPVICGNSGDCPGAPVCQRYTCENQGTACVLGNQSASTGCGTKSRTCRADNCACSGGRWICEAAADTSCTSRCDGSGHCVPCDPPACEQVPRGCCADSACSAGQVCNTSTHQCVTVSQSGSIPTYVDLKVGQSTGYTTRNGVRHTVTLVSQSLSRVVVRVDGTSSTFDLTSTSAEHCGSTWFQQPRNIRGVLVLPEAVSDLQNVCGEPSNHRRWTVLKFSWESGNEVSDRDVERPGYARLLLFDPGRALPSGVEPVDAPGTCKEVLFSSKIKPFLKKWQYGFHAGVDYGLPKGTPIRAARRGKITRIEKGCSGPWPACSGCGNRVYIEDGTFRYSYCHFKTVSNSLAVGQTVAAGTYLGELGDTGLTGGWAHLHFGMKLLAGIPPLNEALYVNPIPYLNHWCR